MSTLAPTGPPETAPASPYVGLTSYTQDDSAIFFGRDAERRVLISNLRASRLTLLYARSGTGKSSLLRAGVAARLREFAEQSRAERGARRNVPVVFSSWHDDPTEELIATIEEAISPLLPGQGRPRLPRAHLADALEAAATAVDGTLLVILDQFEEYLLAPSNEAREGRFADELAACLNRPDLRANVLIAIREDAYAGLGSLFKSRIDNVYGNYLHLTDLERKSAQEAITRPIDRMNDLHPELSAVEIEPALVDAVLDQLSRPDEIGLDRTGTGAVDHPNGDGTNDEIAAPYLQLVMKRLWETELVRAQSGADPPKLHLRTLTELGGAGTIVRTHVDRALSELSSEDRDTAVDIFRHLVTRSGTKLALTASDLADFTSHSEGDVQELLERLTHADVRILHDVPASPGTDRPRFEISHDLLAPAILDWCARVLTERAHTKATVVLRQRQQRLASIAMGLVVGVVVLGGAAWYFHQQSQTSRSVQRAAQAITLLASSPGAAVSSALSALSAAQTQSAQAALRTATPAYLRLQAVFKSKDPQVTAGFAGDREVFTYGSKGSSGTATLWTIRTHRQVSQFRHLAVPATGPGSTPADHCCAVLSSPGKLLVTIDTHGSASLYNLRTGSVVALDRNVSGATISPAGARILTWGPGGATVWNADGSRVADVPDANVLDASFASDQELVTVDNARLGALAKVNAWRGARFQSRLPLPSVNSPKAVVADPSPAAVVIPMTGAPTLFNLRTGTRVARLVGANGAVDTAAFDSSGRHVVTAAEDSLARVYDAATGALVVTMPTNGGAVKDAEFSHDGALVATAGNDGRVRVWNALGGLTFLQLAGARGAIHSVSFGRGDRSLVATSDDGTTRVWAVEPDVKTAIPPTDTASADVPSVAFDTDTSDGLIGIASPQAGVLLWRPGSPPDQLHAKSSNGFAFSPGGAYFVTTTRSLAAATPPTANVWSVKSPSRPVAHLRFKNVPTVNHHPSFSPDGRSVIFATVKGARIWNWEAAGTPHATTLETTPATAATFSPDGRSIAVGGKGEVTLWNAKTFTQEGGPLALGRASVVALRFDPRGRYVAAGAEGGQVAVWNAHTHQRLAGLPPLPAIVTDVHFSADGRWLVIASTDGTVRVWDWENGTVLATLQVHAGATRTAQFMPKRPLDILSTGDDGITEITHCYTCVSTSALVDLARGHEERLASRSTRP